MTPGNQDVVERTVVREVAGIIRLPETLDKVVDALELAGFDRADIDVMGDMATVRKRFGTMFIPLEDVADIPDAPRRAFLQRDDVALMRAGVFGALFYVGATVAAMGVVASGGALAAALAAAAAAGTASGGLGTLAMRFLGKERASVIDTMVRSGGLVIWVRARSPEREKKAEAIMHDHGLEAVRVHDVALEKHLDDIPLADVIARRHKR